MANMADHRRVVAEKEGIGRDGAAELLFEFGMRHATGEAGPPDLVSAHMWFNLAAMRGSKDAVRWRQEIAAEMSPMEIAAAQRAARDWLITH